MIVVGLALFVLCWLLLLIESLKIEDTSGDDLWDEL